jgi:phosphatidylserine/phosphatidylglycerophosphate/cardiolipin synthase-like enzyme
MNLEDFKMFLRASLADHQLSRGERRALSQTLEELKFDPAELDLLRRSAFELVREQLAGVPQSTPAVDWLEDVLKLLGRGAGSPTSPARGPLSEAYFSPGDACRNRISGLFREAKTSADVCVFTITDDRITGAIVDAHRRGVRVRIITDNDKAFDVGSDIEMLQAAGIEIRPDITDHHMHHKFAIFDGALLLNGSYNWTRSAADYNEENIVVTTDPQLRQQFQQMFDKLWEKFGRLLGKG